MPIPDSGTSLNLLQRLWDAVSCRHTLKEIKAKLKDIEERLDSPSRYADMASFMEKYYELKISGLKEESVKEIGKKKDEIERLIAEFEKAKIEQEKMSALATTISQQRDKFAEMFQVSEEKRKQLEKEMADNKLELSPDINQKILEAIKNSNTTNWLWKLFEIKNKFDK